MRAVESGEAIPALTAARRWTGLAPDDERAALQVMRVLHAMGAPGAALRAWDDCVAWRARELDASPSAPPVAPG